MRNKKFYPIKGYLELQKEAISNLERFWEEQAKHLEWFKQWDKVLIWEEPFAKWFVGGQLNASYLCIDRHLRTWRKNKVALYWEDEEGNEKALSYSQLWQQVNKLASVLKNLDVKKGDIVVLYLPMIPELPIAMLACARIGAIHTVVFSGFSSQALADRINDTGANILLTADFGIRRGKLIPLKEIVDEATKYTPSIEKIIIVRRKEHLKINIDKERDYFYQDLIKEAGDYVEPEPVEATHPLYILYTSGTTGKPKGILHSTGGYLVFNYATYKWVFNISDESIYWCTADVGWVTGHSSIVYAPLLHGATILIYEGAPDYPLPTKWWQLIEKYRVSIFYTSPTAIRMFMAYGEDLIKEYNLNSLKILGSVGEAINPEVWYWYYTNIGKERCPIVDTWWQTETGGIMISPAPGLELVPLKPGSVTLPLPGIDAEVVDEQGKPVKENTKGYLVIRKPWPGMLLGIYKDEERYKEYWSKFKGMYYTGDYAMRDEEGYFWLLGRADEVLKVAGHRLGTAEIESCVLSIESIAEAAVIGKPHPIKGESIVIFIVLKRGYSASEELKEEIKRTIRKDIGPIATPEEILFVEHLPKTRSGKILRRVLKAVALSEPIGDITTLEDDASIEEVKTAYEKFKQMLSAT